MVPVELRSGQGRSIGGYAAVFNKLSGNLGGFVERVNPTFFNKMRSEGWPGVMCRWNHDNNMLLGTTEGRTLRLSVDDTGLFYEVDPPASLPLVSELVARGDVRKSSFAFFAPPEGQQWALSEQGFPQRTLHHDGQLIDVAPVNTPTAAYPDSSVALRSLATIMGAEFEEVRSMAEVGELRRFFVKTESGKPLAKPTVVKPRLFGPSALAELDARRNDPTETE